MKYFFIFFTFINLFIYECEASENLDRIIEENFLSICKTKPSLMNLYTEKLNMLLLINPNSIADEKIINSLRKLQEGATKICYDVTIDQKISCIMWIKNETEFFNKTINERKRTVEKLYYAAFDVASAVIIMHEDKFEAYIGSNRELLCKFEKKQPIFYEKFMQN